MTEQLHAPSEVAAILVEALPYIRQFHGSIVVVKFGGAALAGSEDTTEALSAFAEDVALLRSVGLAPVVVHGGGPQIAAMLARLGLESEFRDGHRVTDAETLDIARMVLVGKVNSELVAAINVHGALAVGVSGFDANLLRVGLRDEELGFVGDVDAVDPTLLHSILAQGLVPVVATMGSDSLGQAYNVNADTAAGALAASLHAEKLVMLTDVDGVRRDASDPIELDRRAHRRRARGDGRRRERRGWHGPEGARLRRGAARRGRRRAPPRRAGAARGAARAVHRSWGRHHGDRTCEPTRAEALSVGPACAEALGADGCGAEGCARRPREVPEHVTKPGTRPAPRRGSER